MRTLALAAIVVCTSPACLAAETWTRGKLRLPALLNKSVRPHMTQWMTIIVLSALTGAGCAWLVNSTVARILAAAIPWFGMLAWLLYHEYFVPYSGGGASMWPVALLFAGTVAAAVGIVTCVLVQRLFRSIA